MSAGVRIELVGEHAGTGIEDFTSWARETIGWNDFRQSMHGSCFLNAAVQDAWWIWKSAVILKQNPRPVVLRHLEEQANGE